MSVTTNVDQLKLNIMTQQQYDLAEKSATELYMITDAPSGGDQVTVLPTASALNEGQIYQYVGATDANYTNGYFYKCVGAGDPIAYSWETVEVQADSGSGVYLPLAGGTMSGAIKFGNNGAISGTTNGLNFYRISTEGNLSRLAELSVSFFVPAGEINLGSASQKWKSLYTKSAYTQKLNNGADIDIPTVGGSLSVQVASLPTAASTYEGQTYQYIGTTDANYTNGYFYKCEAVESIASASQTTGTSLSDVAVTKATFETQITTTGTYAFTYDGSDWSLDNNVVNIADYGITFTDTPVVDDVITVDYTAAGYAWARTDVQPSSGGLPSQSGNAGKFLTTDGTDASWSDKPLVNKTTSMSSIHITPAANPDDIQALSVCVGESTRSRQTSSVCVGWNSIVDSTAPIGVVGYCTAIGSGSQLYGHHQTFVGGATRGGSNSSYCIGIGAESQTAGNIHGAIQLGKGTNSESGTLYVSQTTDGTTFTNTKLLDSDGTVPTDRYTTTPSSDGNYVPTLSISSGTATRSWTSIASSVSSSSTNAETVGAKLFYDTVGDIVTLINAL